ncbi:hypothetical protein ACIQUB_17220 [Rhizobium sp. NPDC090275]|uniref:hypothetical protein n=1 Tax=Rhizobium sp. NPDC090275 TaxID=3364498 RepID=UPI00383B57D3
MIADGRLNFAYMTYAVRPLLSVVDNDLMKKALLGSAVDKLTGSQTDLFSNESTSPERHARSYDQAADGDTRLEATATSDKEQPADLGEVNCSVNSMDQSPEHNAAALAQSTASNALAEEAGRSWSLILRFSLRKAQTSARRQGLWRAHHSRGHAQIRRESSRLPQTGKLRLIAGQGRASIT